MRIRDWSSDVCSSDLVAARVGVGNRLAVVHLLRRQPGKVPAPGVGLEQDVVAQHVELLLRLALDVDVRTAVAALGVTRSEEHTSELQSLMRISYAVFCLKKKNKPTHKDSTISLKA